MPFKCSAEHLRKNNEKVHEVKWLGFLLQNYLSKNYLEYFLFQAQRQMWLLPSRRITVTDKNINLHWRSCVNTSINTTIQFPHFHRGTMSAVELCGPGFVFIGTKLWYALVSNVSARIECCSPETWSPRCSCEILDTMLSYTTCRGSLGTTSVKEVKSKWISLVYLHVHNTERACVRAFMVNLARSYVKAPHIAIISVTDCKTRTTTAHATLCVLHSMLPLFS